MELNPAALSIINSTTNSEQSSKTCNPEDFGLVVKYGSISYRDQEINFLSDPSGHQCFAQWEDRLIDLGLDNIYYKEDMCRLVDYELDFITDFRNSPNFVGAKLEYFHNGDFRDIKLTYKGRILKVFLVAGEVNETRVISEAERILRTSCLLDEI